NYPNILVAIDGWLEAEHAVKKAVLFAKKNKSQLFIAHISDNLTLHIFPNIERQHEVNDFMIQDYNFSKKTMDTYKKCVEKQGLTEVQTILRVGSPKVEIAKNLPNEFNIDLILLGATGLNAVERLLMGSVSEYVTRNAPCDVLIARSYDTDLDKEDRIANDNF